MADDLHPVVELMVERMKSYPEEFVRRPSTALGDDVSDRWYGPMSAIMEFGNDADKAAIKNGLRTIRLDAAHEDALDELLNGPDRRAEEAHKKLSMTQRLKQQQQASMAAVQANLNQASLYNSQLNAAASALGVGNGGTMANASTGIFGTQSQYDIARDAWISNNSVTTAETLADKVGVMGVIKRGLGIK